MDQEQSPHPDGAAAGSSAAPLPEVLALLTRMGADVAVLQGISTMSLSDAEHSQALSEVYRMRARLEAAYLHLLRTFDTRPDAVPGAAAGTIGATHLIHTCHLDPFQAHRDVKAARTVDVDGAGVTPGVADTASTTSTGLPRLGAALAAGTTSRAHLDAATRCLSRIPKHLLDDVDPDGWSGAARVDAYLADQAKVLSARDVARLGEQLLALLDPDGQDTFDPDAHTRRELTFHTDTTGMLVGRFALDPAAGSLLRAAINALVKNGMNQPDPGESPDSQPQLPLPEDRNPTQRRADALTDLARAYLHGSGSDTAGDAGNSSDATADHDNHLGTAGDGGGDTGCGTGNRNDQRVGRGKAGLSRPPTTHVHVWATAAQIAAARAAQPHALDAQGNPIAPPGATFHQPKLRPTRPRRTRPGHRPRHRRGDRPRNLLPVPLRRRPRPHPVRRERRDPRPRHHHPPSHRHPATRPHHPRPGLHRARLHRTHHLVRRPPHRLVAPRRPDRHRKPGPPVRPPSHSRARRALADPDDRRHPLGRPTPSPRPHPNTTPKHAVAPRTPGTTARATPP